MNTYQKKQVTVVIDMAFLRRFLDLLDQFDISGYTAVPAIAGAGESGSWRKDKLPTEAGSMGVVYLVIDDNKLDELLEEISPIIEDKIGIIVINEVTVLRGERF
ncbi:DUF190 domain-containing protein [Curvivirga aplysinae]|uniref:DUF190 domain-containing protein n=1 Tax=Curvivirga aplysinae TaxID=2529852 RepID=UPI0012BB7B0F|nr:DUF190 domain-containing protein [Curvivirga aplysinae]MTI08868.1 hypothetical protein [Curvivirga aplysinae]